MFNLMYLSLKQPLVHDYLLHSKYGNGVTLLNNSFAVFRCLFCGKSNTFNRFLWENKMFTRKSPYICLKSLLRLYVPVCTRKWNCVLHLDYCTGTGLQRGVQIRKLIWRNRGRTDNSYFKAFQRISIDLQESFLHEHNYNFLEHWERNKNLYICLLCMILHYLLKKFWFEKVVS